MMTPAHGKQLNEACSAALASATRKVMVSMPDGHAKAVLHNCVIAVEYVHYIHQIGIGGFSPIAVSLSRTFYEIVCSTMYLAENKSELEDFVKFGALMHYEIAKNQRTKGKDLNILFPDHQTLYRHFDSKRRARGGKLLSWHGMTIEKLGKTVGMEKSVDTQIVRSQYSLASKLVHGDTLGSLLLYDLEETGTIARAFGTPMEIFRLVATGATCALFIALLAFVQSGLSVDLTQELASLNDAWRKVMLEAFGADVEAELRKMEE